tara:strand:- start:346 stop:762 length:417 start_codon:yes stop_codon:yes gene_type:complete
MIESEQILKVIAEYFGFTYEELKNSPTKKLYNYPKQLACHFMMALPDMTLKEVGNFLNVDHSTVHRSKRIVSDWLDVDVSVRKDVNAIHVILQQPNAYSALKQIIGKIPPNEIGEFTIMVINNFENYKLNNKGTAETR